MVTIVTRAAKGEALTHDEVDANFNNLNSGKAEVSALTAHTGNTANPHAVTKAQVGLGNVDNTSDLAKPVSTATQTALNGKEATITAGTTAQYWRGDKSWQTLDKAAVGLANVDNTSDASKPVSTAQQTALNAKANLSGAAFTGPVSATALDSTPIGQTTPAVGSFTQVDVGASRNYAIFGARPSTVTPIMAYGVKANGVGTFAASVADTLAPTLVEAGNGFIAFRGAVSATRNVGDAITLTDYGRFDSSGNLTVGNTRLENGSGYAGVNTASNVPFIFYQNSIDRGRFDASGNLLVGTTSGSSHKIYKTVAEPSTILEIGGATPVAYFSYASNTSWNPAGTAMLVARNSGTSRSISAAGTVNTSGADYAEYMRKALGCGEIAKGAIVGVNAQGLLTDKWADAVSFVIKSTDPSYVGGDTWGSEEALGMSRPTDTEAEDYAERLAEFEAALEEARSRVDRIAYAGQVPVNVFGANVGDYIVPVKDGADIKGIAVAEDDMTLKQYMKAVGIVQNILPDGRANIRVKVA